VSDVEAPRVVSASRPTCKQNTKHRLSPSRSGPAEDDRGRPQNAACSGYLPRPAARSATAQLSRQLALPGSKSPAPWPGQGAKPLPFKAAGALLGNRFLASAAFWQAGRAISRLREANVEIPRGRCQIAWPCASPSATVGVLALQVSWMAGSCQLTCGEPRHLRHLI